MVCRAGIIGQYILVNGDGLNITVNGDTYRNMTTQFFAPTLHVFDVNDKQDFVTYHTSNGIIDLLPQTFEASI